QSLPTPMTKELALVVVNDAVSAPVPLPDAVAPMAPEPFVPVASTPLKVTTVIDAAALRVRVAVAVTFVNAAGANARQISEPPRGVLVRRTRTHVNPPPPMPVTLCPDALASSMETNASTSSFPAVVENAGDAIVVPFVERPNVTVASIASGLAVAVK